MPATEACEPAVDCQTGAPGSVLVVGASGLVGTATVKRFLAEGWDVTALSRREPEVAANPRLRHVSVDLRDEEAASGVVRSMGHVTHLVYAAVHELPGLVPGWSQREQMITNEAMFKNLLLPLAATGHIEHVTLLQGTKAYGAHLHPIRVPARERHPRDDHPNFYWLQEDILRQQAGAGGFGFTIMRPQLIVGPNIGVVMNLPPVIGAYAAICRAEGRPFGFPGGAAGVWEAADCRLVADAIFWAARSPAAWGEHFNLTNGEVFSWRDLWPALADELGVQVGPDDPVSMAKFLPSKAGIWATIVQRHGLRNTTIEELVGESHHYADLCFAYGAEEPTPPIFVSTVKIKQAGFTEVWDTEDSFRHWLGDLVERRILPRF